MEGRIPSMIRAYYWATPGFLILDLLFGINIRVSAFIDHPTHKYIYYLFCFGCLSIVSWKPGLSTLVGITESAVNIAVLCIEMWLSILLIGSPITTERVFTFILSGTVCISSFYRYISTLDPRRR